MLELEGFTAFHLGEPRQMYVEHEETEVE